MKKLIYILYSVDSYLDKTIIDSSDCKQNLFNKAEELKLDHYIIDTVLNNEEIVKHETFKR